VMNTSFGNCDRKTTGSGREPLSCNDVGDARSVRGNAVTERVLSMNQSDSTPLPGSRARGNRGALGPVRPLLGMSAHRTVRSGASEWVRHLRSKGFVRCGAYAPRRASTMRMHTATDCNGSMTEPDCASSNQCDTAPTHIVVVVPGYGRFTGRAGDRIPDIAPR